MGDGKAVLITGISGTLGARIVPLLTDSNLVGVDIIAPPAEFPVVFEQMDLGREASCRALVSLLRRTQAAAVVHLAFMSSVPQSDGRAAERQWQVNIAGTARVMEAITEVNRTGGKIRKFIFTSSVAAYGPELDRPATEERRLAAEDFPYAVSKREADEVVQFRADTLGDCSTFILRPHIHAGAGVHNLVLDTLRGITDRRGKRVSIVIPRGHEYLDKQFQVVHIDDVARLVAYILRCDKDEPGMQILNVAGRGQAITTAAAIEMSQQRVVRLPGWLYRRRIRSRYERGISPIPPEAIPYLTSSSLLDTSRLRKFLGAEYENVIRHTVINALSESLRGSEQKQSAPQTQDQPVA